MNLNKLIKDNNNYNNNIIVMIIKVKKNLKIQWNNMKN